MGLPRVTSRDSRNQCRALRNSGKGRAAFALEILLLQLLNGGQVVAHAGLIVAVLIGELLVGGDVGFVGHHAVCFRSEWNCSPLYAFMGEKLLIFIAGGRSSMGFSAGLETHHLSLVTRRVSLAGP